MAKGYVIARAIVTNPTAWADYAVQATAASEKYGGVYMARGGRCEVVEGEARSRNVVIEFESFDAARAYVHSPEYGEARKLREHAGVMDMIVVEGA